MHFTLLLACLSSATIIFPLATAFSVRKYLWENNQWLTYFLLNHLISEVVTISLALNRIRNLEAMLFFSLIEGILLLLLYRSVIEEIPLKRFLKFLTPAYVLGFVGVYFFLDYNLYIPSYTYPFHQVVMLVTVLLFFADRMKRMNEIFLTENPMFWISCGFLFFYTGSIFYFALHDTLFASYPSISKNGWLIHSTMLVILNLFLAIGIFKIRKT